MDTFDQFRQELRDALTHLHHPDYHPTERLCAILGRDPEHGTGPVQSDILHLIEELKPPPDVPPSSPARRDFDLLHHRFVLRLTQEQTAERLHMSVRSVRRAQRVATHMLARLLWEHSLARELSVEGNDRREGLPPSEGPTPPAQMLDWRTQVRQDLSSLQTSAPGTVANVAETIRRAVKLEQILATRYGVELKVDRVPPDLVAAIHPSVLRQTLVMAIGQLTRYASPGQITLRALQAQEKIEIALTVPAAPGQSVPDGNVIQEILASLGGTLRVVPGREQLTFYIQVPSAGQITVLVIDDNLDQVHFYRRCTAGTRYRIVHAAPQERTVEAIQALAPDVIILDIIMPQVDGWELLANLQQHAQTRDIPVIVCSIIHEKDLASLLGAALYLPKPVHHREFIQALAQVLDGA